MRILRGRELFFGVDASGAHFWLDARTVGLDGFVAHAMTIDAEEAACLTTYVEIGRRPDGTGYLDLLLTRAEFDAEPANTLFRDRSRQYDYRDWRAAHRVGTDICPPGVELYYGVAPAAFVGEMLGKMM